MNSLHWNGVVNGKPVRLSLHPARRLVDLLRENLGLTGTKVACELGRCGACMVLMDGKPVNACLIMAYQCDGKAIETVEGLAEQDDQTIQQAFMEEGGFQCGYCTPGMMISVKALLDETPNPTVEQIKEGLSGNLCRCTGYGGILRAVQRCCKA